MRRARTRAAVRVKFRDGSVPAFFVCAAFFAAAMCLSCFSRCNGALSLWPKHVAAAGLQRAVVATDAAVLVGAMCVTRLLLGALAPETLARNSRVLLLGIVATCSELLSFGVVRAAARIWPVLLPGSPPGFAHLAPFLLPVSFAPVLATLLCGSGAATALAFGLSAQALLLVPRPAALPATLMSMAAAAAVPPAVARARDRAGVFRVFAVSGAVQTVMLLASAPPFMRGIEEALKAPAGPQPAVLGAALAICAAGTLAVAPGHFATLGLLPLLEHLFAACSNLRLAKFADLRNPLLSRLAMEAPGTYHHSLVVANLASQAADQIGANSLLCLVGGYYHDVGKLSNPANFTENHLPGDVNPHDSLPPNLSAIILASHVKDGVGQALDNNLPAPVRQIIREHHGTSKMAFFLNKARRLAAENAAPGSDPDPVDENQFRYAGPRPRTAESAIVSIADSVEAASRSLDKPSPAAIEKMVDGIVAAKAADGQFDEAPLTYAEVAELRRAFTAALATIRHARIAYPGSPAPAAPETKENSGDQTDNNRQDAAPAR